MTDLLVGAHAGPVDDDDLAAQALAADPDAPLPTDAVPFEHLAGPPRDLGLPAWYMPAPAGTAASAGRWRRRVVYVVVAAFLAIEAAGLCTTYGPVVLR